MNQMRSNFFVCIVFSCLLLFTSCNSGPKKNDNSESEKVSNKPSLAPQFDADSAYLYTEKQTLFGPRVPNTQPHILCGDYLVATMKHFGAEVIEQKMTLKAYNGDMLNARNIISVFNPSAKSRILLFAHWDSRPYADHDPNSENHRKPILGANDGASGVGVLMEIARQIGIKAPQIGIDIIFFDAEDYGTPDFYEGEAIDDSWCLGAQYWSVEPHVKGYTAKFGILLDMVGAKNAFFMKEGFSMNFAQRYVEKIWQKARENGYGKYFVNERGGFITDDHLYVNKFAGIPSVDIIHTNKNGAHGFFEHWHTINDTMEHIDRETLKAVGQTVLEVIYNEDAL